MDKSDTKEQRKMTTIREETKTQGAKMKGRPLKEKTEYFWEYYRIHTLVAVVVIALAASMVHTWVTAKDSAVSIVMINSIADSMETVTDEWKADLSELLDYDPKKYEITTDATIMLGGENASANQEYASSQKMAALLGSGSIDILIADTQVYEQYAQNQCLTDLRDIYTADELEALSGRIYYTDAATYSDYESMDLEVTEKQAAYVIDHRDPDAMKDPIPVGLYADEATRVGASGIYSYLTAADTYQGYPKEAVMGIPTNSRQLENALITMEYLLQ